MSGQCSLVVVCLLFGSILAQFQVVDPRWYDKHWCELMEPKTDLVLKRGESIPIFFEVREGRMTLGGASIFLPNREGWGELYLDGLLQTKMTGRGSGAFQTDKLEPGTNHTLLCRLKIYDGTTVGGEARRDIYILPEHTEPSLTITKPTDDQHLAPQDPIEIAYDLANFNLDTDGVATIFCNAVEVAVLEDEGSVVLPPLSLLPGNHTFAPVLSDATGAIANTPVGRSIYVHDGGAAALGEKPSEDYTRAIHKAAGGTISMKMSVKKYKDSYGGLPTVNLTLSEARTSYTRGEEIEVKVNVENFKWKDGQVVVVSNNVSLAVLEPEQDTVVIDSMRLWRGVHLLGAVILDLQGRLASQISTTEITVSELQEDIVIDVQQPTEGQEMSPKTTENARLLVRFSNYDFTMPLPCQVWINGYMMGRCDSSPTIDMTVPLQKMSSGEHEWTFEIRPYGNPPIKRSVSFVVLEWKS